MMRTSTGQPAAAEASPAAREIRSNLLEKFASDGGVLAHGCQLEWKVRPILDHGNVNGIIAKASVDALLVEILDKTLKGEL